MVVTVAASRRRDHFKRLTPKMFAKVFTAACGMRRHHAACGRMRPHAAVSVISSFGCALSTCVTIVIIKRCYAALSKAPSSTTQHRCSCEPPGSEAGCSSSRAPRRPTSSTTSTSALYWRDGDFNFPRALAELELALSVSTAPHRTAPHRTARLDSTRLDSAVDDRRRWWRGAWGGRGLDGRAAAALAAAAAYINQTFFSKQNC